MVQFCGLHSAVFMIVFIIDTSIYAESSNFTSSNNDVANTTTAPNTDVSSIAPSNDVTSTTMDGSTVHPFESLTLLTKGVIYTVALLVGVALLTAPCTLGCLYLIYVRCKHATPEDQPDFSTERPLSDSSSLSSSIVISNQRYAQETVMNDSDSVSSIPTQSIHIAMNITGRDRAATTRSLDENMKANNRIAANIPHSNTESMLYNITTPV